ncbi:hypothetical protein BDB01DRAFT_773104 [Pilobolus umbonatus]|nr:hypothetical protein BDB01DRAFT_773104 [Pilobolus umbonatus]
MYCKRYVYGILLLLVVVFIWVTSSFVINNLFDSLNYNKPFFITYLNTATFSFYLVPWLFKRNTIKPSLTEDESLETRLLEEEEGLDEIDSTIDQPMLSTKETIHLSFYFCFLWFMANYGNNASLGYTSVTSSTILSSMSGLFTLGMGTLFKVESINRNKIIAVISSFIGVLLVTYSDVSSHNHPGSNPIVGDILALLGALFYGWYTTLLKLKIHDEARVNMPLFFGFVGLFNVLLLWPFFFILHYSSIEPFELPTPRTVWIMILLNAFIGSFLSDYLWLLAMLMTSPLVVTLGVSLTIPLAMGGEIVIQHFMPDILYGLGALLVISGFFLVNSAEIARIKKKPSTRSIQMITREQHENPAE